MRQFFLFLMLLPIVSINAQFVFDFPPRHYVEQHREQYTPPTFKSGEEGLKVFLQKNFKRSVPHEAVDGRIIVAVIVTKKGGVENAQVVRSLTRNLDTEAVRVCKRMKFRPATLGKKKVRGRIDITFPIRNGRLSFFDLPTTDV